MRIEFVYLHIITIAFQEFVRIEYHVMSCYIIRCIAVLFLFFLLRVLSLLYGFFIIEEFGGGGGVGGELGGGDFLLVF